MDDPDDRTRTTQDLLDPARAAALHAALGRDGPPPGAGDALPPFWHQIYFWDPHPSTRLGRDGHPVTGGLIPDLGLRRRMWAGGRLKFHDRTLLGTAAERTTVLETSTRKQGRTGSLGFVTLRHEIRQNGVLCITEFQDLVYREDPRPDAPQPAAPQAPAASEVSERARFDSTLLFRYSALSFNGHRIHYDLDYCRQVEGYEALVVHGPLLAQLLIHLAERQLGGLSEFSFRATAPLMHTETCELCWSDGSLWVRGPDGRLCMEAQAS